MRWWRAFKVTHASYKATGLVTKTQSSSFLAYSQPTWFCGPAADTSPDGTDVPEFLSISGGQVVIY